MLVRPIAIRSDDLTLPGELVVPEAARALLVLCRGIPGSRTADEPAQGYSGFARDLAAQGYAACWFFFRGCYEAPGDFSAAGWSRDLEATLDALAAREEVDGLPRVLVGSSAGGATAIAVGSRRDDVVAVATLAAVASWSVEGAGDGPALLQRLRNSGLIRDPAFPRDVDAWTAEFVDEAAEKHVGAITPRPLLLIHGDADDVVPYTHAERLFSFAGEPKELARIPAGAHQLRRDRRAVEALLDWLNRKVRPAN